METLVYEESPLADYLDIQPTETAANTITSPPTFFAPHGWKRLRTRLRDLKQHAAGLAHTEEERFLERFRYLIIASQLFEEQSRKPPPNPDLQDSFAEDVTLSGAAATAALSFIVVWALSSARNGPWSGAHWTRICLTTCVCAGSVALVLVFGRRRYMQRSRQSATNALSTLLEESHAFDSTFNAALRLVQEVEIVARGYEMYRNVPDRRDTYADVDVSSQPLPPITRMEPDAPDWKCGTLRRALTDVLASITSRFVEAHNVVHQYTNDEDLQQYHGIYDISLPEYLDAVSMLNSVPAEHRGSLRDLRFSYQTLCLARKVFLCDLLALPSQRFWQDTRRLSYVASQIQDLALECGSATQSLATVLGEEGSRSWSEDTESDACSKCPPCGDRAGEAPATPGRQMAKAQKRRLDALAAGIRSLNAKVLLFQQEADAISDTKGDASQLPSTLSKQYENLGVDIKGLLAEWEQGKKTMFLSIHPLSRYSRSSSGFRSPMSPSPSLGGLTMVDDGPADALRVLNGDEPLRKLSDFGTSDEEVFEAMASPRRKTTTMMSREERMAKIQEDRKKRATLQEHADQTTHMLRELEMVIKHRPRGRTASRLTT